MIFITLGNGVELGIDEANQLFIRKQYAPDCYDTVNLGLATNKQFDRLKEYLDRLRVHAVEEDKI